MAEMQISCKDTHFIYKNSDYAAFAVQRLQPVLIESKSTTGKLILVSGLCIFGCIKHHSFKEKKESASQLKEPE